MKKALLAIVAVALVALALWLVLGGSAPATPGQDNNSPVIPAPDSSAKINQDIENTQVNDLDQDFKAVDADLNQL